ncbi:hypothetical protein [Kozakia baliensis]|uniref:hypothetical protein n=1 Tax=Kozakia baliensis TaxID=153496 RepID=UPI0006918725|nr:hypothetical protein [Kozakia baliensis]
MCDRARQKLNNSLVDPDDPRALERYATNPNLPGRHLVNLLLRGEEAYARRYGSCLQVFLPWARGPQGALSGYGAPELLMSDPRGSFVWNAERYVQNNPGLRGWTLGPLMDFLLHGWIKGRHIS